MGNVQILCDSGCDVPERELADLGIGLVSLSIRFGAEEFTDRVNLSAAAFWERCAQSPTLPETAAPSPGTFLLAYQRAVAGGASGIIVVTLSGALSATYESARLAAEEFRDVPVFVLDSRTVSMAAGLIVLDLAEAAQRGSSFEALVARGRGLVARAGLGATLATLEHLVKGGRIGGLRAFLGQVLAIKPLLAIENGVVEEAGRQRTVAKALAVLVEMVASHRPVDRLAVVHANSPDVATFVELLRPIPLTHPLIVADVGPTIGTHGGPGLIGVGWLESFPDAPE